MAERKEQGHQGLWLLFSCPATHWPWVYSSVSSFPNGAISCLKLFSQNNILKVKVRGLPRVPLSLDFLYRRCQGRGSQWKGEANLPLSTGNLPSGRVLLEETTVQEGEGAQEKVPLTLKWGTENTECLFRADTYSEFLALLIREERLEKPDAGPRVHGHECVFGILGRGGICLWESTVPHPGRRLVGEVGCRDKKNHASLSL